MNIIQNMKKVLWLQLQTGSYISMDFPLNDILYFQYLTFWGQFYLEKHCFSARQDALSRREVCMVLKLKKKQNTAIKIVLESLLHT